MMGYRIAVLEMEISIQVSQLLKDLSNVILKQVYSVREKTTPGWWSELASTSFG